MLDLTKLSHYQLNKKAEHEAGYTLISSIMQHGVINTLVSTHRGAESEMTVEQIVGVLPVHVSKRKN